LRTNQAPGSGISPVHNSIAVSLSGRNSGHSHVDENPLPNREQHSHLVRGGVRRTEAEQIVLNR